jgi:4-hydroxythreonine-4-phosphate dehydrogenase
LAVTPGDPDGIGPEITWKTLRERKDLLRRASILCVGARAPFDRLGAPVIETTLEQALRNPRPPRQSRPCVWLLPAPIRAPSGRSLPGYQSGWSIETATRLVLKRKARAIVTGPISKERLQAGGFPYPGHTEFLAKLCGVRQVTMMLANPKLRVTLVTTHLALKEVPGALTRSALRRAVIHTIDSLREAWKIAHPRVAIAALNPHAGEGGLFGREEAAVIAPEIRSLRARYGRRAEILGPLPADTLFANHAAAKRGQRYDAVVCMYHDQGRIPGKLLDFPHTVNITLGLPIVRTSVDHGTGFDIAGKGVADPSSLQSAIERALEIHS